MRIEELDIMSKKAAYYLVAIVTVALLLIPFTAMQFTDAVTWDIADFIVMSFLIFGMGGLFVLIARKTHRKYSAVIALTLAIAFLYIWAELAVGVFTSLGS